MFGGVFLGFFVVLPVAAEPASVVVVVRVLRVGDVRAGDGVERDHDRQVRHGGGPLVRRRIRAFRFRILRTAALNLVLNILALITHGHTSARIRRYVRPGSKNQPCRREIRRVLQTLRARPKRVWRRFVDSGKRMPSDGPVHSPISEFRPLDLPVGVVGVEGGGQGRGRVVWRGGVARGCLRGGGVGEVCRHEVPHLVACSVVVGPVLRAVVVGAGVRLRWRVAGVRVLLLLWVHCGTYEKNIIYLAIQNCMKHLLDMRKQLLPLTVNIPMSVNSYKFQGTI